MKPHAIQAFSFIFFFASICFASEDAAQTTNRFSTKLKSQMIERLDFLKLDGRVQITAKAKASLPLEYTQDHRFDPSDGFLSKGDLFIWPGCGFDRTSYHVLTIDEKYIEISYSRGTLKQDGYSDTGVFTVIYSNAN
jgi:hypothetical protein